MEDNNSGSQPTAPKAPSPDTEPAAPQPIESSLPHLASTPAEPASVPLHPAQQNTDQTMQPAQVQQSVSNDQQQNSKPEHKTDVMGIISIIMAFINMQLIGIIFGLIGMSQAKKEGRSNTLSKIGLILNIVFGLLSAILIGILIAISFSTANLVANDTKGKTDVNTIYQYLEVYHNDNDSYPSEISTVVLPGVPADALVAPDGGEYEYRPLGCIEDKCTSYEVRYKLVNSDSPDLNNGGYYSKTSLN
jgi:hypothetical protein